MYPKMPCKEEEGRQAAATQGKRSEHGIEHIKLENHVDGRVDGAQKLDMMAVGEDIAKCCARTVVYRTEPS